jgi:hypothetical protein
MHDRSLSWLDSGMSIKSGEVKQFLWVPIVFPQNTNNLKKGNRAVMHMCVSGIDFWPSLDYWYFEEKLLGPIEIV